MAAKAKTTEFGYENWATLERVARLRMVERARIRALRRRRGLAEAEIACALGNGEEVGHGRGPHGTGSRAKPDTF